MHEEEKRVPQIGDFFCNPKNIPDIVLKYSSEKYSHLDENGCPPLNYLLKENDIVIGKI
jgi:hypothetical protein